MTRTTAVAIHLGISLAIFGAVLALLIWAWYPWPLFDLENGWQGVRLVALVDVVLGPALTLVLFKPGKPGLKFDMSMVVLLQVAALSYGVWNLYDARPVLLVHANDHFKPLSRALLKDWDPSGEVLEKWEGPTLRRVRVDLPDDPQAFGELYAETRRSHRTLHQLFDRYRPLESGWGEVLRDAIRIEQYVSLEEKWQRRFDALMGKLKRPVGELAFFPYVGRERRVFLVFDREGGNVIGVLDIPFDPALGRREVSRFDRVGLKRAKKRGPGNR